MTGWACEECGAVWTGDQCSRCGNRTRIPTLTPGCDDHEWGPCVRHVSIAVSEAGEDGKLITEEYHVAERLTYKPDGTPHTTYANSKWVKLWPVSPTPSS